MTTTAPVIIEVALNGVTTRERNPHVPRSPDEIARDAIECIDAGASIVHVHNAEMGLPWREAAARYAEALRPVRDARPSAVLYPTMGGGATIAERYDHHVELARDGVIDMGVIDPGSVNLAATAPDGTPPETGHVYVNSPADIAYMMDVCRTHRIGPSFAIYEPGFLRTVLAYHRSGALAPGSLTKFYFSGEGYFGGGYPLYSAPPIVEALDLYCAMLRDHDLPWGVAQLGGDVLATPVARLALERGGHLRVGLEDDPSGPRNVEQVQKAVALCNEVGRPVATPEQTREILSLPSR
ncbi:MAG TPA: 3-keto-5-aminohexanoate cleavage protein [Acidimicrobiales bacterium]